MGGESGYGPVVVLVFKTGGRGGEPRRWVRLPRALASTVSYRGIRMLRRVPAPGRV